MVEKIQNLNYVRFLEIFVIALPILFHAGVRPGGLLDGPARTSAHYGYFRNWMWLAQRISGVGVLLFLLLHVIGTRILAIWNEAVRQDMFAHMQNLLRRALISWCPT